MLVPNLTGYAGWWRLSRELGCCVLRSLGVNWCPIQVRSTKAMSTPIAGEICHQLSRTETVLAFGSRKPRRKKWGHTVVKMIEQYSSQTLWIYWSWCFIWYENGLSNHLGKSWKIIPVLFLMTMSRERRHVHDNELRWKALLQDEELKTETRLASLKHHLEEKAGCLYHLDPVFVVWLVETFENLHETCSIL